jgi:ribose-phosphate pyrophosphokinase
MADLQQDPAPPITTEERVSHAHTGSIPTTRDVAVFTGSAHPALAAAICAHLGVPLLPSSTQRFSNDCLEVQLEANCRERDVFMIQPLVPPVQENLMELLLMLDAARGASASRLTAVIPYYAYARSDKKDKPRISIGGRMVADVLVTAGASRILTMALHSPQVHGFFSVPVDNLTAVTVLSDHFAGCDRSRTIVVSPDLGNAKSATVFARLLGLPVAAGSKRRIADDRVVIDAIVGDVDGRDVIVLDDEIANAGTIVELSRLLRLRGVRRISVACTHGLFTGRAIERMAAIPEIAEIITTDTVPIPPEKQLQTMTILSIAPLMSEAIRRIHGGESVSALFASG